VDGTPMQRVRQRQPVVVDTIDASAWTDQALRDAVNAVAERPFDLERGPVFTATVFTRSAGEHVLALAFHHIAYDDWSGQQIARELPVLYAQQRGDDRASLPALEAEFSDYVRWQQALLDGPDGERLWQYWKARLGGDLPALNLPTTRPRPPAQTFNGASFTFALSDELAVQIQTLARAQHTTPYVIALTAFEVLLHRLTGQDDILVGTPTAGRSRSEFAGVVGYLVNPVVLRADLSGDPTFLALAARVQETVLEAMEHADFPFGVLVERLQPVRDPARSPIFQVAFVWDRLQRDAEAECPSAAKALRLLPFDGRQQGANFDLDLTMFHDGRSMFGSWKFNTDLFDLDAINRLHRQFEALLEGIAADPERAIADLPLRGAAEWGRTVFDWNETGVAPPAGKGVHHLVEEQVARTPDATAVVFGAIAMNYRELNARADQVAHVLRARGVGPEVLVGVCMERSVEMVVALLAVLKAGGAYVPLDPTYPSERLGFMLADANVAVLVAQPHLGPIVETVRTPIVWMDAATTASEQASVAAAPAQARPDQLAYVIFTSGSTGRPKGAMNSHQAIVNRLLWMQEAYGLTPEDRVLQKTPFSFDVSVWEFFWPLLRGATLVMAPPESHKDPAALVDLIERHAITTLHFVPSMLRTFLDDPGVDRCRSLRRVFCSGEALP
ncbi:MAG: condensation domain-containing protein, partial [Vicinamibacterales bacterium]